MLGNNIDVGTDNTTCEMVIRPVAVKFVSYAPVASRHPLYLRGGAGSLPSKAERLAVEWHASSPSKIEGVAAELATQTGAYESNYDRRAYDTNLAAAKGDFHFFLSSR